MNANAIGYYRAQYDEATLAANTRNFGTLPDGDRIALLDDQWAFVEAGAQKLPSYLALVSAMGSDMDERAWNQIAGALGVIEYDERGTPGHAAFTAYARTMLKPVAARLGWDAQLDENPDVQNLRRTVLGDLGDWGDPEVIAEARRRFANFVKDRQAIRPDDQAMILNIVANHADAATFGQLHAIAKSVHDETELRRYYLQLSAVRDPKLAEQVAQIALSDEIPAQASTLRINLIFALSDYHPLLSWKIFTGHSDELLKPFGTFAPAMLAQGLPQAFWNAVPLDELEAWIKAHVPAEMAPDIARGMAVARFQLALKQTLVPAADRYVQGQSGQVNPPAVE